jgi:predicted small lipoprotein YifL
MELNGLARTSPASRAFRTVCFAGVALVTVAAQAGCAGTKGPLAVPSAPLVAADDTRVDARELVARSPFTVLVFFSRDCHCLDEHGPRLRELFDAYHPRGVQFLMVDSEVDATVASDLREAVRRGYPFPILIDHGARLANALDAKYATYSVVVNPAGQVLYRGGIDSDRVHLHPTTTPYLRNALDDLLAGHSPRIAEAKTLGCSLQKW